MYSFKSTVLDSRKSAFLVLVENPTKNFFSLCFGLASALKKNRRTNVLLVGIFENAQKKVIDRAKTKEKYEEIFLKFLFQNSKMLFFGGQPIFTNFFPFSFSFQQNRHINVNLDLELDF